MQAEPLPLPACPDICTEQDICTELQHAGKHCFIRHACALARRVLYTGAAAQGQVCTGLTDAQLVRDSALEEHQRQEEEDEHGEADVGEDDRGDVLAGVVLAPHGHCRQRRRDTSACLRLEQGHSWGDSLPGCYVCRIAYAWWRHGAGQVLASLTLPCPLAQALQTAAAVAIRPACKSDHALWHHCKLCVCFLQ